MRQSKTTYKNFDTGEIATMYPEDTRLSQSKIWIGCLNGDRYGGLTLRRAGRDIWQGTSGYCPVSNKVFGWITKILTDRINSRQALRVCAWQSMDLWNRVECEYV